MAADRTFVLVDPLTVPLRHEKRPGCVASMRGSQVAVLLVTGSADLGAPLAGAERPRDANPQHILLVVIRGADDEWFSPGQPEVMKRVLAWFDTHAKP